MRNLAGKNFKIYERKSSKFGRVGMIDVGNELEFKTLATRSGKTLNYYDNLKRWGVYRTALDKFQHDQVARPIINMIVSAIFSSPPDFQGDDELVKRAKKIIEESEIDWSTWGSDLEVYGDVFIRWFLGENNKDSAKIASIPAQSIVADCDENNVLNILRYIQTFNGIGTSTNTLDSGQFTKSIPENEIAHIKINNTTNMIYGSSTLRPVFWWLDVLDNLWERNWIRAAQYYGSPITVVTGVPGESQAAVSAALEAKGQRPGRNWVFGENVKVDVPDFTRNYPIQDLIDRIYQYVLSAAGIPQHLIFESDSSRGVAMFSGDGFEMLIKLRRQTWALGLRNTFKEIFKEQGVWKEDSKFSIGWAPVFRRDLDKLAKLMEAGLNAGIMSKRTAREMMSIDHSDEVERMEKQKEEEPDEPVEIPAVPGLPAPVAPKPKAKAPKKPAPAR